MNSRPPKFYRSIKNYQDNAAIRPVVLYIDSPTNKQGKKVNSIFKEISKFTPTYSIENSFELIMSLKNTTYQKNVF